MARPACTSTYKEPDCQFPPHINPNCKTPLPPVSHGLEPLVSYVDLLCYSVGMKYRDPIRTVLLVLFIVIGTIVMAAFLWLLSDSTEIHQVTIPFLQAESTML